MKKLIANELSRLGLVQSEAMNDRCNIIHVTYSSGTYSTKGTESRSMVSGVACGIQFTNGQIRQGTQALVVDYDAVLRLPASQTVLLSDEIELVEKGDYLISGTFKPYSQPVVSSSVQHVQLKRVVA